MTPYRDPSPPDSKNVNFDYVALVSRPEPRWPGLAFLAAISLLGPISAYLIFFSGMPPFGPGPGRPASLGNFLLLFAPVWAVHLYVTTPKSLEEYERQLEAKYEREMAKRARDA